MKPISWGVCLALAAACGSGGSAGPAAADGIPIQPDDATDPPNLDAAADTGSAEPPAPGIGADPVTQPLTGSHQTYDVGPGRAHEDPDTVPWATLEPGDVVNVYYRAEPYRWKIGLRAQGTAQDPIVVNGVTDAEGRRPHFAFDGARTAAGAQGIFSTSPENGETLGGIVIIRGTQDSYDDDRPRHIQLKNLELTGAAPGYQYTTLAGATVDFAGGSAGVYVHVAEDILLENLVIHDNGNGIFTMAKDGLFAQASKRITIRGCRIFGNGQVGSYREHNVYLQAHLPVVEGNFFGQVRPGSDGSSYKSRSSGEVFRFNHVVASSRAVDWVYSEEQQIDGIGLQPEYGTDYAYGNVVVSDASLPSAFATSPIHYGGDNLGEDEPGQPRVSPEEPYRKQLYFWNNTVVFRMRQEQAWRANVFDLSLVDTAVDAWSNIVVLDAGGATPTLLSWVQYAGVVNLRGTNLAFGIASDAADTADASMFEVATHGTLLVDDAKLDADLRPQAGSPAIGAAAGLPEGVPAEIGARFPWDTKDLGALEATP